MNTPRGELIRLLALDGAAWYAQANLGNNAQLKAQQEMRDFCDSIADKHETCNPHDMLAVWEYYVDTPDHEAIVKLPSEGYSAHRQYIIDHITPLCNKWWDYLNKEFEYARSYDWEFLPAFLGALPTHDVDLMTDAQQIAAATAALEDMRVKPTPTIDKVPA